MGHQYPLNSRPYQAQRDFLNSHNHSASSQNTSNATITNTAGRQVYFDPGQLRTPPRVLQRRAPLYQQTGSLNPLPTQHSQHPQQLQQPPPPQRNLFAYQTRDEQLVHALQAPSVIPNQHYGERLYEPQYGDSYEQEEFASAVVTNAAYCSAPTLPHSQTMQTHPPSGFQYELEEQLYFQQECEPSDEAQLPDGYQQQECFVEQQQPVDDYATADEGYTQAAPGYCEDSVRYAPAGRMIARHPQHQEHQVVAQQHHIEQATLEARRRFSAPPPPANNSHYQMGNMHHMRQLHHPHHHHQHQHQQQQQQQQPPAPYHYSQQQHQHQHEQHQQRHNMTFVSSNSAAPDFFDPRGRARASLSDEQVHQQQQHQYDSRLLMKQPVQSVAVQNQSRLAPPRSSQVFYAQTNGEQAYGRVSGGADASLSTSTLIDFIPSSGAAAAAAAAAANLPLRNGQDMIMNNGSLADETGAESPLYVAGEEALEEGAAAPVESSANANMNISFESLPYAHSQQAATPASSTILTGATSGAAITSTPPPTTATADPLARIDPPPETNEKPVAPMLSSVDVQALSRTHVDTRDIEGLPYRRADGDTFGAVYKCNSVTGAPTQPTEALQHQHQNQPPPPPPPQQQQHSSQRSQQQFQLQQQQQQQQSFANLDDSLTPPASARGLGVDHEEQMTGNQEAIKKEPLTDSRTNEPSLALSSPKSNPREYLEMGTSGTVRQDWLDTICGHLIEHMNNFGICVIDNFLGSLKGEQILEEVHRLYSNKRHSKGRLVSDKLNEELAEPVQQSPLTSHSSSSSSNSSSSTEHNAAPFAEHANTNMKQTHLQQSERRLQGTAADATGAIRSDRVIWVDGCEAGCEEINNLIQTLCSVITNSSRLSLYSNNGLDKANINKRTKAHVACYPGSGTRYIKHVDNPNNDGRVITAIYYLNKNWNTKRDGGLLRMFPAGMDEVANIEPLFDRALFFWSDRRNPHEVLPSFRDRYAITVWYIGESRA